MKSLTVNVKVRVPDSMTTKRVAALVKRLVDAGQEDAANSPPEWFDPDTADALKVRIGKVAVQKD